MAFARSDLYTSLRERARQNRDDYEANALANAQDAEDQGMGVPWGFTPTAQTRINLGRERAQANFNPQMDAFFQAVQDAAGGRRVQYAGEPGTSESEGYYTVQGPQGRARGYGKASGIVPALKNALQGRGRKKK